MSQRGTIVFKHHYLDNYGTADNGRGRMGREVSLERSCQVVSVLEIIGIPKRSHPGAITKSFAVCGSLAIGGRSRISSRRCLSSMLAGALLHVQKIYMRW